MKFGFAREDTWMSDKFVFASCRVHTLHMHTSNAHGTESASDGGASFVEL